MPKVRLDVLLVERGLAESRTKAQAMIMAGQVRVADQVTLKPANLQAIRDGLWMVVNHAGTGGKARIEGRDVSGKTGTAQVISLSGAKAAKGKTDRDLQDNAWFVFLAPRDNPQIAGVVLAEHGGHGGTSAAPIARHVLDTFFAKQEGRPLPTLAPAKPQVRPSDIGDDPIAPPQPAPISQPFANGGGAQ